MVVRNIQNETQGKENYRHSTATTRVFGKLTLVECAPLKLRRLERGKLSDSGAQTTYLTGADHPPLLAADQKSPATPHRKPSEFQSKHGGCKDTTHTSQKMRCEVMNRARREKLQGYALSEGEKNFVK